jgi:hypothetical protein
MKKTQTAGVALCDYTQLIAIILLNVISMTLVITLSEFRCSGNEQTYKAM